MVVVRKDIGETAVEHLAETGNPAVGWGDSVLLHEIAAKAGLKPNGPATERRVLNALGRSPLFENRWKRLGASGRFVMEFWPRGAAGE